MSDRAAVLPIVVPPSAIRVVELDALRGLAALAVGLYHLTYFIPFMIPGSPLPSIRVWWGCYGVQVFFAISGFVILGTLERSRDLGRFAAARARRLFPEYWAAMTVTAIVAALLGPPHLRVDLVTWIANLPMLQLVTRTPMVDGVYWSLNVEIAFYAALGLAWRLGWTRRIETLVLGWLALRWLAWALPSLPATVSLLLVDQAPYFSIGLIAYRVWTGERRWHDQLPVLAAVFASVLLLDPVHAQWLFAGLVPMFLLLATGRLRWLARPALVGMGALSYPFYLLHAAIGYCIVARLEAWGLGANAATLMALAIGGGMAALMAAAFERGRRRRGLSRSSRGVAPVVA